MKSMWIDAMQTWLVYVQVSRHGIRYLVGRGGQVGPLDSLDA